MKRFIVLITVLTLTLPGLLIAQGTLIDDSFYSVSLDETRMVDVYLPEGYDDDEATHYPVIYYLHGWGQNQSTYPWIITRLNQMIADHEIEPTIMIKPNGDANPLPNWDPHGSQYANSELNGLFEDYIVYDLIEYIDDTYRTIPDRTKRGIMGLSMGGGGSMRLALTHPDIYSCVASHSGVLDFSNQTFLDYWVNRVLYENSGPPYNFTPTYGGTYTLMSFSSCASYSPNLDNPPYQVDFFLDSQGELIDSVWDRCLQFNPPHFAAALPPDADLTIYFDCATQDEMGFYPTNQTFADSLDALGIEYQFQSFGGGHSNLFFQRFPIGVAFLDSVMNHAPGYLHADLSADVRGGEAPVTVQFTDQSETDPDYPIISRAWDFDLDGIIDSSELNPVWTYDEVGFHSVRLIVSNSVTIDTLTKTNYILTNAGGFLVWEGYENGPNYSGSYILDQLQVGGYDYNDLTIG
ncbi:MAG: hypothetical protein GY869_00060 [Planctomycetes bacterium]|nr:hypothetical protein [Planctomycetota bacterium]